jgi:uncharacterized membrane protein
MKYLRTLFISGLAVVLPVSLTIYLLCWLAVSAEDLLGSQFQRWLGDGSYFPGLGILAALALILVVGALTRMWVLSSMLDLGERIMTRIPLVKTIYNPLKDMMAFFTRDNQRQLSRVVRVRFGQGWIIGFVTRDSVDLAGDGEALQAVYFPLSYQIGGYTLLMSKDDCEDVAMGVEEAMRFALTAGLATNPGDG